MRDASDLEGACRKVGVDEVKSDGISDEISSTIL